jgi:signal transduction histidine kinase
MRKDNGIKQTLSYTGIVILIGVVYHLTARLGLLMANLQPNTSPVWPPTGIAIAALLLFGIKYWPGVTLGVFFGYLFNNNQLNVTLGLAVGNTLEAVVAVYLLSRFGPFQKSLTRIQDVIRLAVFSAFATMISASIGVLTLLVVNPEIQPYLWSIWFTWWIGDFLGALVITPLLLVWIKRQLNRWERKRVVESLIVLALLILVTGYVFINQPRGQVSHEAMIYVIFPFVIYAALKFTQIGAVTSVLLVSGIAIYGTAVGSGPLVRNSINDSLILLQTFMGIVSLTALTLAATTSQRQAAETELQHRVEDLAKLNDTSRSFLGIFDSRTMYDTVCRFVVEKFGLKSAWITLLADGEIRANLVASHGNPDREPRIASFHAGGILAENNEQYERLSLPLNIGGKEVGQLVLQSDSLEFFNQERTLFLTSYANLASVAIQNTWLMDQVRSGNERLHALSHRLMEVQEAERLNLSRELHDESGQVISAMMVQLGLLERDAAHPEMIQKYARELKHIASDVLSNLHEMAVRLRPASLDHLGLVTALEQHITEFSRQNNLDVQFETVGISAKRHSPEIETAIFRVVQESLSNVLLHANASRVDVILSERNNSLSVTIEDDGIGFIPENSASQNRLGLFGMRERVEMLGGRISIESGLGKGTTIQVEVPNGH